MQVVGVDQLLLMIYISILHPDATLDEMATFIYNEGAGGHYSNEVLSKQLKELEITKKASSTEAYQAFEPQNVLKVQ
jgi:hypothetical protein